MMAKVEVKVQSLKQMGAEILAAWNEAERNRPCNPAEAGELVSDAVNTQLKAIPEFSSEAEERQFWETHDSTE